jgi:hypothetical protein
MKQRELICATIGAANTRNTGGREATQKMYRGLETEKGNWIARSTIALNALAAFSVGMLSAAIHPAKGGDASPVVQIPQDEAPPNGGTSAGTCEDSTSSVSRTRMATSLYFSSSISRTSLSRSTKAIWPSPI